MSDPHNVHHNLYRVGKSMLDPGDAGIIHVSEDLQILEIVTTAAETRTLADPTKAGIRFVLRLFTDGGNLVVTAAGGLNAAGNTQATFADASDMLELVSVKTSTGFRWQINKNVGAVSLA